VLAALDVHDDGTNGDARPTTSSTRASSRPDGAGRSTSRARSSVEVHAETKSGEERVATVGFLYSVPLAHLTGRYRDAIVDGISS
jgi:hypothetical protein